jgi:hypothetical protein
MKILYPNDWGRLGTNPQIVALDPLSSRSLDVRLLRIVDDRHVPQAVEGHMIASASGMTRIFEWVGLEPGRYIAHVREKRFGYLAAEVGFFVEPQSELPSLLPALEVIEQLALRLSNLRMIGNGIGKSGTTWLYRLLGSLPSMNCLDMTAAAMNGIDHNELERVQLGQVYHGHLRYGLEVVKTLCRLNFCNVHIYRDIRDVVVSEYFHKFKMQPDQHRPDLRCFSKNELLTFESIMQWSSSLYAVDDALSWAGSKDCVMVRFEELLENGEKELGSILHALNLPSHPALTKYIVRRNDFTAVSGRARGEVDPMSPLRNAVPGNWQEHLDPDTAAQIEERFSRYFEAFNYGTNTKPSVAESRTRTVRPAKLVSLRDTQGSTIDVHYEAMRRVAETEAALKKVDEDLLRSIANPKEASRLAQTRASLVENIAAAKKA